MKPPATAAVKKAPCLVSKAGKESVTPKSFRGWPPLGGRAIIYRATWGRVSEELIHFRDLTNGQRVILVVNISSLPEDIGPYFPGKMHPTPTCVYMCPLTFSMGPTICLDYL